MNRLQPGELILDNTYRVERELCRGAFGVVYLATHLTLNVERAVKVLRTDDDGVGSTVFNDYRNRFHLEAQLAARLTHPHVIQVYDFQERAGVLYCVMEYAPGGSLADLVAKQNPLPVERTVQLLLDAAAGLEALHDQLDAVHRDVKPANLLLDRQGRVKVADLGLAQVKGMGLSGRSAFGSLAPPHPGTPNYVSPEHSNGGEPLRATADVYGLGCVAFELLTGRVWKLAQRKARQPGDLRPEIPAWLDAVVARMLSKEPGLTVDDAADPAKRYVDMTAVQAALRTGAEQAHREATEEQRKQEAAEQERRRVMVEQARQKAAAKAVELKRRQEAAARAAEEQRKQEAAEQERQHVAAEQARQEAAEEKRRQEAAARAAEQERQRIAAEQARQEAAARAAEEKRRQEAAEQERQRIAAEQARQEAAGRATEEKRRQEAAEQERQLIAAEQARQAATEKVAQRRGLTWAALIVLILCVGGGWLWLTNYQEQQRLQAAARAQAEATAQAVISKLGAQAHAALYQATGLYFLPVPAGEFIMGSPEGVGDSNEHPRHIVYLDAYFIGATEVTNAQYARFIDAGGYDNADYWSADGWALRSYNDATEPQYWADAQFNQPDQPVVGVSWYEAEAFTRWLSEMSGMTVRLPTEAEWEKAACGVAGRVYPWGNAAPDNTLANFNNATDRPAPVGSYPAGASPYGALDMAGNVLEWVADWYGSDFYAQSPAANPTGPENGDVRSTGWGRVLRGGAWFHRDYPVRCASRSGGIPGNRDAVRGFRVVSPGF